MRHANPERSKKSWKKRIAFILTVSVAIILTITCGKKAPPSPPIPIVPQAAADNKIAQAGSSFIFAFKIPPLSTDDKTPVEMGKLVIYRLKAPRLLPTAPTQTAPTQTQTQTAPQTQSAPKTQNSTQTQTASQTQQTQTQQTQTQTQTQTAPAETPRALSATEFEDQAEKIAEIPEDKIDSYMRDDFFVYQDKREIKAGSEDLQNWFYYGVKLYNKKNKENDFGRLIALFPEIVPQAPQNLTVKASEKMIQLTWDPVSRDIAGKPLAASAVSYDVYRGSHANFAPFQSLNSYPITSTTLGDPEFQFGRPYYYFVRAFVNTQKREQQSEESNVIFIFPQDTYPPSAPQELNVVAAREGMVLIWAPNPEEDVTGYNVYRKVEGEADFKKHNTKLVRETTYSDPDVKPGLKHYYQVSAVDNAPAANESPRSNEVSEVQRNP